MGGAGVISVLSNVMPSETVDICTRFFNGDVEGSADLQCRLMPLIKALFCEVNPIPVKKAEQLMGHCTGVLRRPLTEMEPEHAAVLEAEMKKFGIL